MWLPDNVRVSNDPDVEFIHRVHSENFGITHGKHLCAANRQGVDTWYASAALPSGIGIIQTVVVEEIVSGNLSQSGVCINSRGAFVIPHGLGKGGGGES